MNMGMILSVAGGGAIGAVARYVVMSGVGHWLGAGFPWATLTVNVLGSFILGSLVEVMALVWSPSPELRAMVVVGALGAFTTFSTFSMDVFFLVERNALHAAGLYMVASVVLSVGAFFAGLLVFRHVLA